VRTVATTLSGLIVLTILIPAATVFAAVAAILMSAHEVGRAVWPGRFPGDAP